MRSWLVDGADSKAIEKFDVELRRPPAGVSDEYMSTLPEWSEEAQANSFLASMAMRGARGGQNPGTDPVSGASNPA